jgi:hypothetical protein
VSISIHLCKPCVVHTIYAISHMSKPASHNWCLKQTCQYLCTLHGNGGTLLLERCPRWTSESATFDVIRLPTGSKNKPNLLHASSSGTYKPKTSSPNSGDSFVLSHLQTLCGKRQGVNIYTLTTSQRQSLISKCVRRYKSGFPKHRAFHNVLRNYKHL